MSLWADLGGRVHWVDHGGAPDGPLLVCVHGLGGSHVNWAALAPLLTPGCRVVALDLAGFGNTRGEGRAGVDGNREVLHRFLTEVVGTPAVVVGNSMGGLVASLVAATHPEDVAGLVLLDSALPPDLRTRPDPFTVALFAAYFTPGLGRAVVTWRRAQDPREAALQSLRLCCAHPERVPEEVLEAHIEFARRREGYPGLESDFVLATRSTLWSLARRRRHHALLARIEAPVLLVHGDRDRLIPVASARAAARAHQGWRYEELADVGHVPQLEAADRVAELLLGWLEAEGAPAAEAARAARATLDRPRASQQ